MMQRANGQTGSPGEFAHLQCVMRHGDLLAPLFDKERRRRAGAYNLTSREGQTHFLGNDELCLEHWRARRCRRPLKPTARHCILCQRNVNLAEVCVTDSAAMIEYAS